MAKFDLDLKKFKHIESDDKMTTLKHKDGHELKIAHKSLSPEFQKQLEALRSPLAKQGPKQANPKLEESKKTPPKQDKAMRMADGGVAAPDPNVPQTPIQPSPSSQSSSGGGSSGTMKLLPLLAAAAGGADVNQIAANGFRQYFGIPVEQAAQIMGMKADAGVDEVAAAYHKYVNSNAAPAVNHGPTPPPQAAQPAPVYNGDALAGQAQYEKNFAAKDAANAADEQAYQAKQNALDNPVDDSEYKTYAKGGSVRQMYAEGDEVADPNQVMTPNPNAQPPQPPPTMTPQQVQSQPNKYVEKYNQAKAMVGIGDPFASEDDKDEAALNAAERAKENDQADLINSQEDARQSQQKRLDENTRRAAIGLQPLPVPVIPTLDVPDQAPAPAPQQPDTAPQAQAQPSQGQGNMGMGGRDPESMLESGYQKQMAGIEQGAQAQGQLGQKQAAVLDQQVQEQNQAKDAFQSEYRNLDQERQAHMQDIKDGYIDPHAYWKDHSKLMSGIGMVLAGFNPTNSPNAAVNYIKFQMEQNLDAQKQNLAAKQNMLNANLRQFGNLRDAMDMTRLMQNDIVVHQLQSAAAKAQTRMAQAAAMQAAGKLQTDMAPMFQNFAMRRAMVNLSQNGASPGAVDHMLGYMRVVNPEMAKEMESRYVPGVGLASIPVPAEVRGQMIAKQQFGAAANEMLQWAQQHSGSLDPKAILEGRTKAANLQNLYRQGINGGVFKQGEQSFINGIVDSDPTKFFNSIRVIPKLQEVARENDNSLNVLKRGYNLPAQRQAPSGQPQIKVVTGVKYQRGPNGEAIRVK